MSVGSLAVLTSAVMLLILTLTTTSSSLVRGGRKMHLRQVAAVCLLVPWSYYACPRVWAQWLRTSNSEVGAPPARSLGSAIMSNAVGFRFVLQLPKVMVYLDTIVFSIFTVEMLHKCRQSSQSWKCPWCLKNVLTQRISVLPEKSVLWTTVSMQWNYDFADGIKCRATFIAKYRPTACQESPLAKFSTHLHWIDESLCTADVFVAYSHCHAEFMLPACGPTSTSDRQGILFWREHKILTCAKLNSVKILHFKRQR